MCETHGVLNWVILDCLMKIVARHQHRLAHLFKDMSMSFRSCFLFIIDSAYNVLVIHCIWLWSKGIYVYIVITSSSQFVTNCHQPTILSLSCFFFCLHFHFPEKWDTMSSTMFDCDWGHIGLLTCLISVTICHRPVTLLCCHFHFLVITFTFQKYETLCHPLYLTVIEGI